MSLAVAGPPNNLNHGPEILSLRLRAIILATLVALGLWPSLGGSGWGHGTCEVDANGEFQPVSPCIKSFASQLL